MHHQAQLVSRHFSSMSLEEFLGLNEKVKFCPGCLRKYPGLLPRILHVEKNKYIQKLVKTGIVPWRWLTWWSFTELRDCWLTAPPCRVFPKVGLVSKRTWEGK